MMGDVKRYSLEWEWMADDPEGEYVSYADYDALCQQLAALQKRLAPQIVSADSARTAELLLNERNALIQEPDNGR